MKLQHLIVLSETCYKDTFSFILCLKSYLAKRNTRFGIPVFEYPFPNFGKFSASHLEQHLYEPCSVRTLWDFLESRVCQLEILWWGKSLFSVRNVLHIVIDKILLEFCSTGYQTVISHENSLCLWPLCWGPTVPLWQSSTWVVTGCKMLMWSSSVMDSKVLTVDWRPWGQSPVVNLS